MSLLRRPAAFRDALSLALIQKGLAEYVASLTPRLDAAIAEIEAATPGESAFWPSLTSARSAAPSRRTSGR